MEPQAREQIAVKLEAPANRCASCLRVLGSGERLTVTAYHDGSLVNITICRPCLAEHVPEALDELTRNQPRRFR